MAVLRGGKRQELVVKIGSAREAARIMAASVKQRLGVEVRALTNKEAEKYGLDDKQGVLVTWLDKKGPLQRAGFEVGDLILEINGQAIRDFDRFIELVSLLRPKQQNYSACSGSPNRPIGLCAGGRPVNLLSTGGG